MEIGDMMIRISGMRGMKTSTISVDTISRSFVKYLHMLHTTSRDVISLFSF